MVSFGLYVYVMHNTLFIPHQSSACEVENCFIYGQLQGKYYYTLYPLGDQGSVRHIATKLQAV
jgi:hypothetical protein